MEKPLGVCVCSYVSDISPADLLDANTQIKSALPQSPRFSFRFRTCGGVGGGEMMESSLMQADSSFLLRIHVIFLRGSLF